MASSSGGGLTAAGTAGAFAGLVIIPSDKTAIIMKWRLLRVVADMIFAYIYSLRSIVPESARAKKA